MDNSLQFQVSGAAATVPPRRSKLIIILAISLLAIMSISAIYYFTTSSRVTIAELETSPDTTSYASIEKSLEEIQVIPTITPLLTWSTPIISSIKDSQDKEIFGYIIGTPPIEIANEEINALLSQSSPLTTVHGWIKSPTESSMDKNITVYQKGIFKLYVKYEYDSYFILVAAF